MRLVLISDTHCLHEGVALPEGDVLVHAGDFCGWGTSGELLDFCGWLRRQDFGHKLIVAGNHDKIVQQSRSNAVYFIREAGGTYLEDSGVTIDGVSFWGSPWTPEFQNWAFMKRRGPDIDERWARLPVGMDVLVLHGPPRGILDAMQSGGGQHIGCEALRDRMPVLKPRLCVFGHNHAGYGSQNGGATTYYNIAVTSEARAGQPYRLVNPPTVVDI